MQEHHIRESFLVLYLRKFRNDRKTAAASQ
jgi:hypothetical protein